MCRFETSGGRGQNQLTSVRAGWALGEKTVAFRRQLTELFAVSTMPEVGL